MTLGEAKERVSKAQQMVDQIIGPFKEERLNPILQWTMVLLGESGAFSEYGSWEEILVKLAGRVEIRYKSRLANVQKKIRLMSIAEYTEMSMFVAGAIPDPAMQYEFLAQTDWTRVPKEILDGTNAPDIIARDPKEAKQLADGFRQAQAEQQQAENGAKIADAEAKGSSTPQPGSPTAMLMGQ